LTTPAFTRKSLIAAFAGLAAFAAAAPAHAARDAAAERYVQENASVALATLGDASLSRDEKQQTFYRLVAQFSEMPRIAVWVLGRHGTQLAGDRNLRAEWTNAFQDFAIATYEFRLNRFSGSAVRVTGSSVLSPNSVIVTSEIIPAGDTRPTIVRWRLNRAGQTWKVFDLQIRAENGDSIWLGQLQQQEFLAALDRNGGDVRALMRLIQTQTASMRQRMMTRG
jgi:phospholipid transport system substrate-binding protein